MHISYPQCVVRSPLARTGFGAHSWSFFVNFTRSGNFIHRLYLSRGFRPSFYAYGNIKKPSQFWLSPHINSPILSKYLISKMHQAFLLRDSCSVQVIVVLTFKL